MKVKKSKSYITDAKTIAKKLGIKEEITHIYFKYNGEVIIDVQDE